MITKLKEPYKEQDILKILHPFVKEWFLNKFKSFSLTQLYGVMEIHKEKNILISAPTGGTKTLTAFLTILNELVILADNNLLEDRVYAVYISPLKALSTDVQINLITPLKEINEIAKKHGKDLEIRVGLRTGDTTPYERQKLLKKPSHILVSTPESLAIMLTTTKFREFFKGTKYCIIDEAHALAENKRGTYMSITLERLQALSNENLTRIGLSATIAPLDKLAHFLVGTNRDCIIADVRFNKKTDIKVISPVPDLINTTHEEMNENLYNLLNDLIQEHKTTLVFTNTRAATERVIHNLKEKFPKNYNDNVGAHHGSLSKEHRHNVENRLRKGELKCVASSTSLELGLDIGYIDLVICLGSPKSISRLSQRLGRSGHKLHETIKGRIIVLDRDDLVECAVMTKHTIERKIDRIHIPENALDVLAQQIYGIAISDITPIKELFEMIKKAYPFRNLTYTNFKEVMDYLSGKHISLEDRHVYAKIWYDEETGMVGKRGKMARIIYMTNIGTIPDESAVKVKVGEQVVGTIDEAFLEKLKKGDVFVLGGDRYMFKYARGMAASAQSAAGMAPTVPSWFSDTLPLSFDLASEIQKFRRLMKEHFENKTKKEEILEFIDKYLYVDERGKTALYEYFNHQYKFTKHIPNENELLIEHFNGQIVFHSLYGRRINDVLSRAMAYVISKLQHRDVEISINDNGFYLQGKEGKKIQVLRAFKLLKSNELGVVARNAIENSEVLKRRFRHCATRSLMILRSYKGKTKRVGRQQVSSMILLAAVRRISNDFAILKEARREVLEDLMDIDNAVKILKNIEDGKIKIKEINTKIPSPFAFNILMQGRMDMLRMEDRVEFLRKMHALILEEIE